MIQEEIYPQPALFFKNDLQQQRKRCVSQEHIIKIQRQLFYLWDFIGQEGLWSEAKEYIDDNIDEPIPYEW